MWKPLSLGSLSGLNVWCYDLTCLTTRRSASEVSTFRHFVIGDGQQGLQWDFFDDAAGDTEAAFRARVDKHLLNQLSIWAAAAAAAAVLIRLKI